MYTFLFCCVVKKLFMPICWVPWENARDECSSPLYLLSTRPSPLLSLFLLNLRQFSPQFARRHLRDLRLRLKKPLWRGRVTPRGVPPVSLTLQFLKLSQIYPVSLVLGLKHLVDSSLLWLELMMMMTTTMIIILPWYQNLHHQISHHLNKNPYRQIQ